LNQFATCNQQQTHLIEDLIKDRRRDMQNLSLINDLIDVRSFGRDAFSCHSIQTPAVTFDIQSHIENVVIDNTIKAILLDSKFNRRADEVIANLAMGRPHLPRVDEQCQDIGDMTRDLKFNQTAQEVMAHKAMRVLETPQLSSTLDCHQTNFPQRNLTSVFDQPQRLSSFNDCYPTMLPQISTNPSLYNQCQLFNNVPQMNNLAQLANVWGSSGQALPLANTNAILYNQCGQFDNFSQMNKLAQLGNAWGSSGQGFNRVPQMNQFEYLNSTSNIPRTQCSQNVWGLY
jgi:hypothetical protein